MIINELLNKYPHAKEVVRDWFIQKMEESFKDQMVPDNFKEFMRAQGLPDDRLVTLFEDNPRVLFDVFDANGVIINTMCRSGMWSWSVNETKNEEFYSSRKEAEAVAVQCAFQILNEKLNITLHEGQDSSASS
jgi:hypothetical protein